VRQNAARRPADLIASCLGDLRGFVNDGPPQDDLTLLAVRRSQ
jgi:serine phosphatase RsbU (regulator of sigma subunit)